MRTWEQGVVSYLGLCVTSHVMKVLFWGRGSKPSGLLSPRDKVTDRQLFYWFPWVKVKVKSESFFLRDFLEATDPFRCSHQTVVSREGEILNRISVHLVLDILDPRPLLALQLVYEPAKGLYGAHRNARLT
jgi:hypothetical protein